MNPVGGTQKSAKPFSGEVGMPQGTRSPFAFRQFHAL